ncbi:hypothetical protein C8J57DRAFT_1373103, partial [Mycena rebaudengoi]
MVLKLYGSPHGAGATAVVAMILTEKRVPFELIPIDTMKELQHKALSSWRNSPSGRFPPFRAICRYILEQYPTNGPQLIPTGVKSKALFEQAASVEFANFDPIVKKYSWPRLDIRGAKGISADPAAATAAITELSSKLDELTLADLFHLGYGSILAYSKCDIMTWWNELLSMQSGSACRAELR